MNDTQMDDNSTWLDNLTPLQMAWRDQEISEGRDPDRYIKAELRGARLLQDRQRQKAFAR